MTSGQSRQLTRLLYVAVAGLAACYLLFMAGFGRGVPGGTAGSPDELPALQLNETQVQLPGLDVYDDLAQRPLFAENRRPEPKEAIDAADAEPEVVPTAPLNVALTGIIHTPLARIALVRDNATGKALTLREQMPLPGDQGGWLVKAIEPRRVVFEDTGTQTETSVDLAIGVAGTAPAASPKPSTPARAAAAPAAAPADDQVAQRAAEIRRRIEERRAQLRRDAEANKQ